MHQDQNENGTTRASGTVEAVEVVAAPEIAGRVKEVFVEEGDAVEASQEPFRLDDELLKAQRDRASTARDAAEASLTVAEAGLETARLQYDMAAETARVQGLTDRNAAWRVIEPGKFDLSVWYFEESEKNGCR